MPKLRVLAGTSARGLVPITDLVNSNTPHLLSSELFEGQVVINIKGFNDPDGNSEESAYFKREDRRDVTWSFQIQGRFLVPHSADDILFGNIFDKSLNLPWGSGAILKFMQYMDPTLEHDLASSTRPWALSPLISTMPHLKHERIQKSERDEARNRVQDFPPGQSVMDDISELGRALRDRDEDTSTLCSIKTASHRRSYFRTAAHRESIIFGPDDRLTMDFCYGYLEFSPSLALRLPGGISFDLMGYWDGQPVRFVCCQRNAQSIESNGNHMLETRNDDPWGSMFWCIVIELEEGG